MKRRDFISNSAGLGAAAFIDPASILKANPKKTPIRVAHLTDMHVKPDKNIEVSVAKAMHHAQILVPEIDFIINGGDAIMDSLEADKEKTDQIKKRLRSYFLEDMKELDALLGTKFSEKWFSKVNK